MEQRTPEWFEARRGRITASIVGALLGLAPYMSKADAVRTFVREFHSAESEFTGNIATDWGVNHEAEALLSYQFETDNSVVPFGFLQLDHWAGMSPDGLIDEDGLVEVKCPFGLRKEEQPKFKSILAGELDHYYAQTQFQMYVGGRKWCDFYQWTPFGTNLERVHYDERWIAEHLPVLTFQHEELLAICNDKKRSKDHLEPLVTVVLDELAGFLVDEYDALARTEADIKARKAAILDELKGFSNGRNADIGGRKLTNVTRAGSISYAKVVKDFVPKGTDLEKYRGKGTKYWQLK